MFLAALFADAHNKSTWEVLGCKESEHPDSNLPAPINQFVSSNIFSSHPQMENVGYFLFAEKREFIAFWYYLSRRNECVYLYERKHIARYKFLFLDLDTRAAWYGQKHSDRDFQNPALKLCHIKEYKILIPFYTAC